MSGECVDLSKGVLMWLEFVWTQPNGTFNIKKYNLTPKIFWSKNIRSKRILGIVKQRTWKDFGALPIEASIPLVEHQSEANLTFVLD